VRRLFESVRPTGDGGPWRDALAGLTLAAMNVPQVLGYTRIAGTPVVTGLYTLLLPLVAFAAFGSSRYLVVAADSATAAILAGALPHYAPVASEHYVALAGCVALLTAGCLLLARLLRLGFLADFLSQTVPRRVPHRRRSAGRRCRARRDARAVDRGAPDAGAARRRSRASFRRSTGRRSRCRSPSSP
jgi:hypothetical protein